jgi:hypothetical protein
MMSKQPNSRPSAKLMYERQFGTSDPSGQRCNITLQRKVFGDNVLLSTDPAPEQEISQAEGSSLLQIHDLEDLQAPPSVSRKFSQSHRL